MTPEAILQHLDSATLWPAGERGATDVAAAYQQALAVRALRSARGELPCGFKIGFTNRTIWERYRVYAPIWGTVWDHTLLAPGATALPLAGLCQPRLEPEIVFGLAATPPPSPTLDELFACVDWFAPGFEVVQAHCEGWQFSAAETVADGGLHGRLHIGPRQPTAALATDAAAFDARLARASVRLQRNGETVEQGRGANVLDGPLHALRHFVLELERCPGAPRLRPGDVVTTGTWTDAWPLVAGEHWCAEFDAPIGRVQLSMA